MTRFSPSAKIKLNFDAPIYFFSSNERPCDKKKGRNRRTRVRVNFRPSLVLSFPNVRPATARSNLSLSIRNAHVRLITEKGIVAGVWPAAWPSLWIATLWGSWKERLRLYFSFFLLDLYLNGPLLLDVVNFYDKKPLNTRFVERIFVSNSV